MAQVDVCIPMDEDLLSKFDSLCYEFGYNASSVFCALAELAVSKQSFPAELEIEPDPFYSPENMAELSRRIADLESGKARLTYHELIEVEDEEGLDG